MHVPALLVLRGSIFPILILRAWVRMVAMPGPITKGHICTRPHTQANHE